MDDSLRDVIAQAYKIKNGQAMEGGSLPPTHLTLLGSGHHVRISGRSVHHNTASRMPTGITPNGVATASKKSITEAIEEARRKLAQI